MRGFAGVLLFSLALAAQAEQSGYRIEVPAKLRNQGRKLRIRNRATGQQKIIDLADEEFLSSDAVRDLMDPNTKVFTPEFSILDMEQAGNKPLRPRREPNPSARGLTKSLVFDQPVWRQLGYKTHMGKGGISFRLDSAAGRILPDVGSVAAVLNVPAPSAEAAARRRNLVEEGTIRKLFDIGWRAISAKRFDLGLVAFSRILEKKDYLDGDQLAQAHLGHGLCTFHQNGCGRVEDDFKIADQSPKNTDDVSYYRGLCAVEAKKYKQADALFKDLVRRESAKYAESSRFFVGVVAENEERYEDAESAYLDTIDFANDTNLVKLAKGRLEIVKQAKARRDFDSKWLLAVLSTAAGYDSNVVALPQDLSPSDYQVTKVSSLSELALLYTDFKIPGLRRVEPHVKYTYLQMHYFNSDLSSQYDLQSHSLGSTFLFSPADGDRVSLSADYNSVLLGRLSKAKEYQITPSLEVKWQGTMGPLNNPTADQEIGLKTGLVRPRTVISGAYDGTATSYLLSWRYALHNVPAQTYGPGLDVEYRPSKGTENSYYSATILGRWDLPVGPESWELMANQEGALQFTPYYQSALKRKDTVLKYTGSVAKLWAPWFETRLQFIGTLSFSSDSNFRYNKAQVNLLLSAFY